MVEGTQTLQMAAKRTGENVDAELLAHIGRDPYGGLARVIDQYGPVLLGRLHSYAEACGYGDVDVEDVFERIMNSLLNPENRTRLIDAGGQIVPWLTKLGHWRLMDADRRRRHFEEPFDDDVRAPVEAPTVAKVSPLADDARRALDLLPPRARQILEMRYGEQLTNEQVGQRLGITPGAAKKAAHDARERLRRLLIDAGFNVDNGGNADA